MDKEWERLTGIIVENTGWGSVSAWRGGDFRKLSQQILDKTGVNVSESTLRRLFGKSEYPHAPNETTLNTLAVFAGYAGWRDFCAQQALKPARKKMPLKKPAFAAIGAFLGLLLLAAVAYRFREGSGTLAAGGYDFTCKAVTRTLPNTVIFHYKAPANTAPLYIQQSWDSGTRSKVAERDSTYTSVYYRPGFYEAKLIAGSHVVKEAPLIIPTNGWLGLVYAKPVPYYLEPGEFTRQDKYEITAQAFTARGFHTNHDVSRAELYNVGNFEPVPVADADFTAMVKSDSASKGNACSRMHVFLITDGVPVSLMLSDTGCVSTLSFYNGTTLVSGKTADLSGFGVARGTWASVEIRSVPGKLRYLINGHIAYEAPLPAKPVKILGVAFGFDNGGAAKSIRLSDHGRSVFQDR